MLPLLFLSLSLGMPLHFLRNLLTGMISRFFQLQAANQRIKQLEQENRGNKVAAEHRQKDKHRNSRIERAVETYSVHQLVDCEFGQDGQRNKGMKGALIK